MTIRQKQQLGGLAIALIGAVVTCWNWYAKLVEGNFNRKAAMLFPALCYLGVALILFPGYREERIARGEDISGLRGWRLITPKWWAIIFAALAVGAANFFLMSRAL